MKKYMFLVVSLIGAHLLNASSCNLEKKYDKAPITDSISQAVEQCLRYYPDDVESCIWCTFDGYLDEAIIKQEINNANAKKGASRSVLEKEVVRNIAIIKKGVAFEE